MPSDHAVASHLLPPPSVPLPAAAPDSAPDLSSLDVPKRDGRRTHIVDRALDYVALADQGHTAARIARKRRKSQGYVSIALRLGRAIVGMEPAEIAALRSPRITWKLAQRIVREDADVLSVRHQLRTALGGFSTLNQDGRKHRKGRRTRAAAERPIGVAWGWDAAWFARDPIGFAEAHLRYLAGVQRSVQQRAARSATARGVERVSVGQGIRTLQRSLAVALTQPGPCEASAERQALAVLEILERKLAEASQEAAALLTATRAGYASAGDGSEAAGASVGGARPFRPPLGTGRPRLTVSAAGAPAPADLATDVDISVSDALEADLRD
jgi:hypothetical protein